MANQNESVQWLDVRELEKRFRVEASTIYRWIKGRGFPPPTKFSPRVSRWNEALVNAWAHSIGDAP